MNLASIILTTLDSERFVSRSIESCLNQTHQNLELLVVDGGSQDGTLDIVNAYQDGRIRVIRQKDNAGKLPGAINLGMAQARGDFITWTQNDSWYESDAIETMLEYLDEHPNVALVYTDFWEVDEAGTPIRYRFAFSPDDLLIADVVGQCFLFRRKVYETLGPQEAKYFPVHEVPWRVRLAQHFRIEPLHQPLFHYTVHPKSLTGRIGAWQLQYLMAEALFQEGYFDQTAYRRRLAKIHIDQAYEEFILRGNYRAFWLHALAGVGHDWTWLSNRGLGKLMTMSLLPGRTAFRRTLFSRWAESDVARQKELAQKYFAERPSNTVTSKS
jgi:glycosyltransferase involved in cell wall biosynthesis